MTTLNHQHDVNELVRRDQMVALVKTQVASLSVNSLLAIVVALQLYGSFPITWIATWLIAIFCLNTTRYLVIYSFKKGAKYLNLHNIMLFFKITPFISGSFWAVIPFIFIDFHSMLSSMLIFDIAGITAGSTVLGSSYAWTSINFVSPLIMSTIIVNTAQGGYNHITFSLSIILFFIVLIRSSLQSQAVFHEASLLKHQAISANAELHQLANHDPLTGLFNRGAFATQIQHRLSEAARERETFSLLLLDLDHFKSINDTLGHTAGDAVLVEIAARLRGVLDRDHAAFRLGGDEFAVLLPKSRTTDIESAVARRLIAATITPFEVLGQKVNVGVSIGIARFPDDCMTSDDLLVCSDLALYAAKSAGRQCFRRFDRTLLEKAEIARDIEHNLRGAIADGSLEVWFQPQVDLADQRLIGLEALIRWRHPKHGWIQPPLIVAAALRIHASEVLTGYVLSQACAQIRRLAEAGQGHVVVAANVSPSEIRQYALPRLIQSLIDTYDIEPSQLELEITEEAFIGGDSAISDLEAISAMGVRLAIDDFGTGCASLAYLRTLRVDRIKIDRCFVTGFAERERDRILVQAILGIARSFLVDVVAEGVETAEEALLLRSIGCHIAQGYYFGQPMSLENLRIWTEARNVPRHPAEFILSARRM